MWVSVPCGICARMDSAETVLVMSEEEHLGGANTKGKSLVCADNNGKDPNQDTPANTKHIGSGGDDEGDA